MAGRYESKLIEPVRYKLIHSHNPDTLETLVNEALKAGAVFCGGPTTRANGEILQAVAWPEKRELVMVDDGQPATEGSTE